MTNTTPLVDLLGIVIVAILLAVLYYSDLEDKAVSALGVE